MASRALICAALLAWPRAGWAADCPAPADVIETDRPDVTNSSLVIPYGSLQVENGVNWAVCQGSQVLDGSETRVRLGIAHCGEVLLDVPNYFGALNGLTSSGLSDLIGDYSSRNRPSQVIDVGGSWHVTSRQQLDFHMGVGLTRTAPDQYIGVGYSFRVDSLFGGAARATTRMYH